MKTTDILNSDTKTSGALRSFIRSQDEANWKSAARTYHLKPGDLYIAPAKCPLVIRSLYSQLVLSLVEQILESSESSG